MNPEEEENHISREEEQDEEAKLAQTSGAKEPEGVKFDYIDPEAVINKVEAGSDYARERLKQIENARQILDLSKEYKISEASAEWLAAQVNQIEKGEDVRFHGRDKAGQISQAADVEITSNEYRELWEGPEAAGIGLELLEKGCPGKEIENGFGMELTKILEIREMATEDLQTQLSQIFDLIGRERPLAEIDDGEVVSRLSDPARNPELAVQFSKIHSEIEKKLLLERAYYQPSSADWFEQARHVAGIDQPELQKFREAFRVFTETGDRPPRGTVPVFELAKKTRMPMLFFLGLLQAITRETAVRLGKRPFNCYEHGKWEPFDIFYARNRAHDYIYEKEGVTGLVRDLPLTDWAWWPPTDSLLDLKSRDWHDIHIKPRDVPKQINESLPILRRAQVMLLWSRIENDEQVLNEKQRVIEQRITKLSRRRPGRDIFRRRGKGTLPGQ